MYLLVKHYTSRVSKIRFLSVPKEVDSNIIKAYAKKHMHLVGIVEDMEWFSKPAPSDKAHLALHLSPDYILTDKSRYYRHPENSIVYDNYMVSNPGSLNESLIKELLKLWDHYAKTTRLTPKKKEMVEGWQPMIEILKKDSFINDIMIQDIIT